jgi:hypothetical protein
VPTFRVAGSQAIAHLLPKTVANRPINFLRLGKSLRGDKKRMRAKARTMVWRNRSDDKNLGKQVCALKEHNGKERREAALRSFGMKIACVLFGGYEEEANSAREKKDFLVVF